MVAGWTGRHTACEFRFWKAKARRRRKLIRSTAQSSLESRFFADDGLWKDAPLLTGQGKFEPLLDVRNILVTGGEGFMCVATL